MRAPVAKQFRVTGVFDAGFDSVRTPSSSTPTVRGAGFLRHTVTAVTGVEMKVKDIEAARDVARSIDAAGQRRVSHSTGKS